MPKHPFVSDRIPLRLIAEVMPTAVDFDGQFQRVAVEIQNVGSDRMLLAEVQAFEASGLQTKPQQHLREGHLPA
jgi:hypothetical protein